MISISQWGLFEVPEFYLVEDGKVVMPYWWAGSEAYQHLNFGPYLS